MSKGINKTISIGNLTADPETRYLPDGNAVTSIRIAMNDSYKDKKSGQQVDKTEYINIVFFRRLAEIAGEYLKKGSKVYIEGKLQTRQWEKEGQKHYSTEIVADNMQMLDSRGDSTGGPNHANTGGNASQHPPADNGGGDFDDDLPF